MNVNSANVKCVDQFQRTSTKWIDGEQNDREMDLLEKTLVTQKRKTSVG